jgi:hypothetical protein
MKLREPTGAARFSSAYARIRIRDYVELPESFRVAGRSEAGGGMERVQPADEWDFLPRDDELEDLDSPEESADEAPETAAIHIHDPWALTPAEDPGIAEVELSLDGDDEVPVSYFDDEQPDLGRPVAPVRDNDEAEPDLEDLLESQHYAFSPEPGDSG